MVLPLVRVGKIICNNISVSVETSIYTILWNDKKSLFCVSKMLSENEEKLKDLAGNINDVIYETNKFGQIIYVSPQIKKYGVEPNEIISSTFSDFIYFEDREKVIKSHLAIKANCNENRESCLSYRIVDANKNILWIENSSRVIFDSDGKYSGQIGVLRDISERKEFEEKIEVAKIEAEKANYAKSKFLANISHELRTPMNGIISVMNLLLRTNLSKQQKEFCDIIKVSAISLLKIINEILDISKIEEGRIELENNNFSLKELIQSIYNIFKFKATEKNIDFKYSIDVNVQDDLFGDSSRIQQIFTNLVSNAIKFTNKGSIVIKIAQIKVIDKNERLLICSVKDTGIGIAPEKQDLIFDAFKQAGMDTTRKYGGTGLGLTITKKLIELMGGSVSVKSVLNQGTTFEFTIKLEASKVDAKKINLKEITDSDMDCYFINDQNEFVENLDTKDEISNQNEILVAEDNVMIQKYLKSLFDIYGYNYTMVNNGEKAVEEYLRGNYKCLLLDSQMPVMGGIEATQIIRNNEAQTGKKIYIVAMTASALKGDRDNFINAGMDNYLAKPINEQKMFKIFNKLGIRSKEIIKAKDSDSSNEIFDRNEFKMFDPKEIMKKYLNIDKSVLIEVIDYFINSYKDRVKKIKSDVKNNKWDELKFDAHSFKGTVGSFYSYKMVDVIKDIESAAADMDKEKTILSYNEFTNNLKIFLKELKIFKQNLEGDMDVN